VYAGRVAIGKPPMVALPALNGYAAALELTIRRKRSRPHEIASKSKRRGEQSNMHGD